MGLTSDKLTEYVNQDTAGIIGTDILSKFYLRIDVPGREVSFSEDPIEMTGDTLALDQVMGIPIIEVDIG